MFRCQHAIGAGYRAAMAEALAEQGFAFRPAGRGQFEVRRVPEDLIETFSKCSRQIEARVGRGASGAQEIAALATRGSKDLVPSGEELEARWRTEFAQHDVDVWAAALSPERDRVVGRDRTPERERLLDLDPPEVAGDTLADLRTRNGTRGTVEAVRPDSDGSATLRVRLEDGRTVEQPWAAFARPAPGREARPPRVVHAYAGTAYSVQGRTAVASVHYVGAPLPVIAIRSVAF